MNIRGTHAHLTGAEQIAAAKPTAKIPVDEVVADDFQWGLIDYEHEVDRVNMQLALPDLPLELRKFYIVAKSRLDRNLSLLSNMSEQAVSHFIDINFG
jgi:hypothetical protein